MPGSQPFSPRIPLQGTWKLKGKNAPVSVIQCPDTTKFSSLLKEAVSREVSGVPPDHPEDHLLIPLDSNERTPIAPSPHDLEAALLLPPDTSICMPITPSPQRPPPAIQSHSNRNRAMKRKKKMHAEGHRAKRRTILEHVLSADGVEVAMDLDELPVAYGGYTAIHSSGIGPDWDKAYTPVDLTDLGFTILEWDGR